MKNTRLIPNPLSTPAAGRATVAALSLVVLLCALFEPRMARANPPNVMAYQGYLVDASGAALAATTPRNFDVVFRIFAGQQGGTSVWAEVQTVTVDKGYFSVLLGQGAKLAAEPGPSPNSVISSVFAHGSNDVRFIGITVKITGQADLEIAPRLQLITSPYAFMAAKAISASSVDGGAVTSGIVPDVRLSNNVALLNRTSQAFTGDNTFAGNVGIGTTAPTQKLDVAGTVKATAFVGNGSALTGLGAWSQSVLNLYYNNGNVGIGTTTPGNPLSVNKDWSNIDPSLPWANYTVNLNNPNTTPGQMSGIGFSVGPNANTSMAAITARSLNPVVPGASGGQLLFYTTDNSSTIVERMRVTESGNVGIGTTTPAAKLQVVGDIKLGPTGQYFAPAGEENLRIVRGNVNGNGSISKGEGFTIIKGGAGFFTINFSVPFADTPTVTVTPKDTSPFYTFTTQSMSPSTFTVFFHFIDRGNADPPFGFIAIGPR